MSRSRYKSIFASSLTTTSDLPTLHYSILGTSLLGEAVPDSGTLCAHLGASAKETNVEALFQVGYLLKEPPSDDLILLGLNSRGIPWLPSAPGRSTSGGAAPTRGPPGHPHEGCYACASAHGRR